LRSQIPKECFSQCFHFRLKYVIYSFDAKKQPLNNNESIEVYNLKIDICDNEFVFKHLHYVNVQAKWMEWDSPIAELKPVQFFKSKSTIDASIY